MLTDPEKQKLKAALEQLEIEKQRRIEEKADRGEIMRVPLDRNSDGSLIPVVVGVSRGDDIEAAYRARKVAELRAAGETREIVFEEPRPDEIAVIVTGVPRAGRDDGLEDIAAPETALAENPPPARPCLTRSLR